MGTEGTERGAMVDSGASGLGSRVRGQDKHKDRGAGQDNKELGQDKDNRERGQDKDKGLGQATVRDIRPHPPRLQQEGSPRA